MLNEYIKEHTKEAHQSLEGKVVRQMKAIRSEADYAEVLNLFYTYFASVERAIAPFVTNEVLPDYAERRNSSYIKADIESLGVQPELDPNASVPQINNKLEALSALYVLEGSIMGGPYIVQMLKKYGMDKGFTFFSGYGDESAAMWQKFVAALNAVAESTPDNKERAAEVANQTFARFEELFNAKSS